MKEYNVILNNQVGIEILAERIEIENNFIILWTGDTVVGVFPANSAVFEKPTKKLPEDEADLT
jgi:hypothetical protein